MSIFKRALLYITRKKSKTILMFLILFGIGTATISGVAIKKATDMTQKSMDASIGAYLLVTPNPGTSTVMGTRGMGAIPKKVVEQVKNIKGIMKYDVQAIGEADLVHHSKIPLSNTAAQLDEKTRKLYKDFVDLSGNKNSKNDTKFTSKSLVLKEGRHITEEDKHKVLVHEDFAKLNQLKLGDFVTVKPAQQSSLKELATEPKPEKLQLEIVGIFSGTSSPNAAMESDLVENLLMTDLTTIKEINGFSDKNFVYENAKFYTSSPKEIERIKNEIKKLPFKWEDYQLIASDNDLVGLTRSFDSMNRLIRNMLTGIMTISIIILTLILAFWMNGRIHETGVLLAMGKSKFNIISQYFVELFMIAVFSFSASYFSGNLIAQKIGNQLVQQAKQTSQALLNQGLGGLSFAADPETSLISKTIDKITVTITPNEVLIVFLLGTLIILAAVCLSSYFILRLKPKEILSKMS